MQDSEVPETFNIKWNPSNPESLYPIPYTENVKATATSFSLYETGEEKSATDNFDINYDNPCFDSRFVSFDGWNLEDITYPVGTGPLDTVHSKPDLKIAPLLGDVCGDFNYQVFYNG